MSWRCRFKPIDVVLARIPKHEQKKVPPGMVRAERVVLCSLSHSREDRILIPHLPPPTLLCCCSSVPTTTCLTWPSSSASASGLKFRNVPSSAPPSQPCAGESWSPSRFLVPVRRSPRGAGGCCWPRLSMRWTPWARTWLQQSSITLSRYKEIQHETVALRTQERSSGPGEKQEKSRVMKSSP